MRQSGAKKEISTAKSLLKTNENIRNFRRWSNIEKFKKYRQIWYQIEGEKMENNLPLHAAMINAFTSVRVHREQNANISPNDSTIAVRDCKTDWSKVAE